MIVYAHLSLVNQMPAVNLPLADPSVKSPPAPQDPPTARDIVEAHYYVDNAEIAYSKCHCHGRYRCLNNDASTGDAHIDKNKFADVVMYGAKIHAAKLLSEDIGEFNPLLDVVPVITFIQKMLPHRLGCSLSFKCSGKNWAHSEMSYSKITTS